MTTLTPQAGRAFKLAAAFLIHCHREGFDADGAAAVLTEYFTDPEMVAGVTLALADLAWQMAAQPNPEAAMEYLRDATATAAVAEVSAGAGGEQG